MNTILFDLDGTLLPMDQDPFIEDYMKALCVRFAPQGYDPQAFGRAMWLAVKAVIKNDGNMRNEDRFWQVFSGELDPKIKEEKFEEFEAFYRMDFPKLSFHAQKRSWSREAVDLLKEKGYDLILATNPLFPQTATYQRIGWAGLSPQDFSLVTTYENSSFCKPFPAYFTELLEKCGKKVEDCMMVGNDVDDDMVSTDALGMKNYLITDFLINRKEKNLNIWQHGSSEDFLEFVRALPEVCE